MLNRNDSARRDEIPQREALRLQLSAIAGDEPSPSYFEIRAKRATGAGMQQDWIPVRELERAARALINRGQMADAYVGVAPRAARKGTADVVERVWCLWADCDGESSLERLSAIRPLPNIVVRSGGDDSAHAYWQLSAAVPPEWAQRGNRRLALALGADRNATDPARILRPAGTFNFKHGEPRPVLCTRLELDAFTFAEVAGHLADDRPYVLPARPRGGPQSSSPSKMLDGLVRTVNQAAVGNRNATLFWAACRLRERVDACEIDDTEGREALREAALSTGLSETETERTLDSALHAAMAAA